MLGIWDNQTAGADEFGYFASSFGIRYYSRL